jgi:ribonucleoside-diphosphate reductase alpha chain
LFESFQIPYILVSALLFAKYPRNTRMKYVKKYYDLISQHYISLPTPIMAGLRTKVKQFSSCTLIEAGDSLKSINSAASAIVDYASRKAGIGLSIGAIRAEGQPVRNGDAVTTGVIPFAKYFNAALKSCSQGAVRGASATFNYPVWHLEFERLIELKNNKGTEETRLRTVDYCVHLNKLFYERLASKGNITFFSPEEVPDLYMSFYSSNYKEFEKLYKQYEKDSTKTKKVLPALDVFTKIMNERFETGRIYILNADHVNIHGSFFEPIKMTNLCTEITLPTTPMGDDKSLIALCTLSAINWGKFTPFGSLDSESSVPTKLENKLRETCEMAVRGLDALLDYQEYPVEAAYKHSMKYRPLGIGIIGFAHWLAKGKLYWGEDNTLIEVENMMEKMAYYLTETSIELAKEFGSIPIKTKYHEGIFPIDTSPLKAKTQMDWDLLRSKVKQYGIRNATLMALMPSETSSQLSNETNGIEPPRDIISIKGSKDGVLPQIVPDYNKLAANYQTLWQVNTQDYLITTAILQKYIDQGISLNTPYDPSKYVGGIKMSYLIKDLLLAYKLGHKTLYYCNTRDGSGDIKEDNCESGACKI